MDNWQCTHTSLPLQKERPAVCVSPCHPQALAGRGSLSPSYKCQLAIPWLSGFLFCQQNQNQNAQQQKPPCAKDTREHSLLPPFPGPDCSFIGPELPAEVSPNRTCSSGFLLSKVTFPHRETLPPPPQSTPSFLSLRLPVRRDGLKTVEGEPAGAFNNKDLQF